MQYISTTLLNNHWHQILERTRLIQFNQSIQLCMKRELRDRNLSFRMKYRYNETKIRSKCRVNHYWPDQKLFQRCSFLIRCHSSRTQNIVFDDSLSQVEGVCNVVKEASRSTFVHVQHNRTIGILGLLLRLYHQFSGGRVENQRLRAATSVLKVLLNALRIWRHFRDQLSVSFSFLRVDDNGCCRFAIIQRRSLSVSGCFLI